MNNQMKKFLERQAKTSVMQAKDAEDGRREIEGHISFNVELRRQELEAFTAVARAAEFAVAENQRLSVQMGKMQLEISDLREQLNTIITGGYRLLNTQQLKVADYDGWPTALHKYRAEQIRKTGTFVDPETKEEWEAAGLGMFYPGDDELVVTSDELPTGEEVIVALTRRGRRPTKYKDALTLLEQSKTTTGRLRWSKETVIASIAKFTYENPGKKIVAESGSDLWGAYMYTLRNPELKGKWAELVAESTING
jgi:hypothetical protein